MTLQIVVGAAIVRNGLMVAARRSAPAPLAGRWEFPGGKVEAGETDADALVRECHEELGVTVEIGDLLGAEAVTAAVLLRVYLATIVSGEPVARQDHDELRWLSGTELDDVDWLPADRPLLAAVRTRL